MTAKELVAQWEKTGVAGVNLDELKALCAENRRLREALEEIAKLSPSARARRTAERALAAEPASGEAQHDPRDELPLHDWKMIVEGGSSWIGCSRCGAQKGERNRACPVAPPPPPTQGEGERARTIAAGVWRIGNRLTGTEHLRKQEMEAYLKDALRQRADEEREKVARWMIAHSYATGHGDTIEDLLVELAGEATRAENEAIADRADHWHAFYGSEAHDIMRRFAFAIRARIAPKGEP